MALRPDISVIVPTLGNKARLWRLQTMLTSVRRSAEGERIEIILSGDGCRPRPDIPDLQIIASKERRGRAAARNLGATLAAGKRLLFVDDDIVVAPETIRMHISQHAGVFASHAIADLPWFRHSSSGQVEPGTPPAISARMEECGDLSFRSLLPLTRRSAFEKKIGELAQENAQTFLNATGGCVSIDRKIFDELAGFDTGFGKGWGIEDLEFGYRAQQAGLRIVRLGPPPVIHIALASDEPDQRRQEHLRNLQYFVSKHGAEAAKGLERATEN